MAQLPGDASNPIVIPQADRPTVSYTGGQAQAAAITAGQATAGLGDEMVKAGGQIQDTQNKLARASAEQAFLSKKLDIDQQFANDPDFATAPQRYRAALQGALTQTSQGIMGASQRADFSNNMARWVEYGTNNQLRESNRKAVDAGRGSTVDAMNDAVSDALRAPDEPTRAAIFSTVHDRIDAAQNAGWFTATEAAKYRKSVPETYAVARAKMISDADPDAAVKALQPSGIGADGTPTFDKTGDWRDYLDPSKRMDVVRAAQQHADALLNHQVTQDARDDALAQRQMRETQASTFGQMYADSMQGKAPSDVDLANAVRTQRLTPEMAKFIGNGGAAKDDLATVVDLQARARNGDPSVVDDAVAAANNGLLKGGTAARISATAVAQQGHGDDQIERASFSTLRSAMGLDSNMQPIVDLGHESRAEQMGLWVQAQREWNQRVLVGRGDPSNVLDDMLAEYARPSQPPTSWPQPKAGTIRASTDLAPTAQKTQSMFDAGSITQGEFSNQKHLLALYAQHFDEEARRAGVKASATTPKPTDQAKAKLRGYQPTENP